MGNDNNGMVEARYYKGIPEPFYQYTKGITGEG